MSISRHTAYNFVGMILPLGVTIVTTPLYLRLVGIERYGVLTLCWILLGYLGFLDLGLGPAVAQKIAASRSSQDTDTPRLFWTALWLSLFMGTLAAALLYLGAGLYFGRVVAIGAGFDRELADALPLLVAIAPVVMVSSVLSGALQGRERFLAINLVMTVGTTLMSILPLASAFFISPRLPELVAGALTARFVSLLLFFPLCIRVVPLRRIFGPSASYVVPLLSFGGWVTLSTIAAPLLLTLDRLTIGAILGAASVAIYAIPYNVVGRLSLIPLSLGSALFPRFAYADETERTRLIAHALPAVAVVVTPTVVAAFIAIEPFLRLWIGPQVAFQAAPIAYIFLVGIWANCFAQLPYVLLQGSGRPDLVAKLLLAEILPYWLLLFAGMAAWGLIGAAAAWAIRMTADCIILSRLAGLRQGAARFLAAPALLTLVSAATAAYAEGLVRHVLLGIAFVLALAWSAFNIPAPLHSRLGILSSLLPRARQDFGVLR